MNWSKANFRLVFCLLAGLAQASLAVAQLGRVPSSQQESMARRELARQGVDEAELRVRLRAKGIDVDALSPEELLALRPEIEATVAEIKAEQSNDTRVARERQAAVEVEEAAAQVEAAGAEQAEEIREAVEEGATAEEAVAEAEAKERAKSQTAETSNIYGHGLFRGKTLDVYRASERARTPGTYILDTGDELAISIFGASQTDLLLEIGDDGFIKPPGIPRIYLRGRTLDEARRLVRSRLRDYYVFGEGQFALSVDAARTIRVSIYGEVEQSGTYTLSALNGPLNALVAAGGPTDRGSVRNILLIREGQIARIDVYAFLQNPSSAAGQLSLRDNDVINVPLAEEVVELRGAVRRPMRYELTRGESLDTSLPYAGGLVPSAVPSASRVLRLTNGSLNVLDLDRAGFAGFDPEDGDLVEIPAVAEPLQNFVEVGGEVVIDGRFGMRSGQTLGDVLERAQLRPTARRDVAFVRRRNDDGTRRLMRVSLESGSGGMATELRRGDVVIVLASSRYVDEATFTIGGAIRDSSLTSSFPQDGALTLEEAILLAGGLEANALAEALVIRTPQQNAERREYLRVPLREAATFQLEPFDRVVIYSAERFEDAPTVSIAGAVRAPTETRYDVSLDINDLLYLAGGASFDAAADRVDVYRLSLEGNETRTLVETLALDDKYRVNGSFELRPFDEVYVRSSADFEPIQDVSLEGEVRYPGLYARIKGANRVSDFIDRAGGLTSEAFPEGATLIREAVGGDLVVLELDEILADPARPENLLLRAGDRIQVPKPEQTVTIYTRGTNAARYGTDTLTAGGMLRVAYQGPQSAKWYIDNYAGGFDAERAKKRTTTVTSAAGGIRETRTFLGIRDYPDVPVGGAVRVDLRREKPAKQPRERSSWSDVAQVTVAALSAIATVLLVVDRS